jgi:hypothetical protein
MRAIVLLTSLLVAFGAQAQPVTVTALSSDDPGLLMPPVVAPDGRTLSYSVGIGSGAFRHRSDPPNVMWTVGDRGPNMTCGEAVRLPIPEGHDAVLLLVLSPILKRGMGGVN